LLPYSLERFRTGRLLTGRYGIGAVAWSFWRLQT
jgi:hypothetical protein